MCGICCIVGDRCHPYISVQDFVSDNSRLYNRGPDCHDIAHVSLSEGQSLVMCGAVLGLRGHLTPQPLQDPSGNVLLWNGEIFGGIQVTDKENDAEVLLKTLGACSTMEDTASAIGLVRGPFSFIYWQSASEMLWFGRDVLGRRSLLWHLPEPPGDVICLSSVRIKPMEFFEVPAAGIFLLNLGGKDAQQRRILKLFPWLQKSSGTPGLTQVSHCVEREFTETIQGIRTQMVGSSYDVILGDHCLNSPLSPVNKGLPDTDFCFPAVGDLAPVDYLKELLTKDKNFEVLTKQLIDVLQKAVQTRVDNLPRPEKMPCKHGRTRPSRVSLPYCTDQSDTRPSAMSDSDGCSECANQTGTLMEESADARGAEGRPNEANVAILFSGGLDSTVLAALADRCIAEGEEIDLLNVAFEQRPKQPQGNKRLKNHVRSVPAREDVFNVPDRQTGRTALSELNPGRKWNFVEIDVTLVELQHYRSECVSELLHPLCTVLDDSIGCAVWFAARGRGVIRNQDNSLRPYTSHARVLLVGMGADEQLAGYSRHRTRFQADGWLGLVDEINMEVERIATRNLGRDDRIITDHGKESRLPFLDENVVSFLNKLPVHFKADLTLPRGLGEKLLLRLSALHLGLPLTAVAPKRAIQFGSRIAKSENRKENAADVCHRLKGTPGLPASL